MLIRVIESLPIMVIKLQFFIILIVLISYHIVLLQIQLVQLEHVPIMDRILYFQTHDICNTCQSPTTIPCYKISCKLKYAKIMIAKFQFFSKIVKTLSQCR
ncbi:unnamed protein product [Paramecium sonneborni]|uniref:Transmembrane protein n=1 Tax=Paramecium sonneborni TaxID=65129 RepID=A0A8S1RTN4_9CILI|nr:unnamed protein product [Paramecium sonneborni]